MRCEPDNLIVFKLWRPGWVRPGQARPGEAVGAVLGCLTGLAGRAGEPLLVVA